MSCLQDHSNTPKVTSIATRYGRTVDTNYRKFFCQKNVVHVRKLLDTIFRPQKYPAYSFDFHKQDLEN